MTTGLAAPNRVMQSRIFGIARSGQFRRCSKQVLGASAELPGRHSQPCLLHPGKMPLSTQDEQCQTDPKRPRRWNRWIGRVGYTTSVVLVVICLVVWWVALRIVEHPSWPPPADAVTPAQAQGTTEEFARQEDPGLDDLAIPFAPATASEVAFFRDGTEYFPGMLADIGAAQHSIHFIMFGITRGEISQAFVDALVERSRASVEVRLIVDGYGAKVDGQSEPYFDAMTDAGIEVVVNDIFPLDRDGVLDEESLDWRQDEVGRADHRKVLVVDGMLGWIGGGGMQDHFNGGRFHDVFARVEGDVVRQMQVLFLTGFRALGGPLPGEPGSLAAYFPVPADPGTIRATLLQNLPGGFLPATQASRAIIDAANERLDVMNPYLTDPDMIDCLIAAAERGVKVRIVVPGISNNVPADAALRHTFPRLLDAGVEIWEYPIVMHAKVMIADDAVIVGSLNYDAWALYRNLEAALLIEDSAVADTAVAEMVDLDVAISRPGEVPEGTIDRIAGWIWDKLVYFL